MKTIVVTGPESSGKTTLCQALASHFHTSWVPEFARLYLEQLHQPYEKSDLLEIAKGQEALKKSKMSSAARFLICDTDLLTIKIWSEFKYGHCDDWIVQNWLHSKVDLYLLCAPDIPWQSDPLRENPNQREVLFELYEKQLIQHQRKYKIIQGNKDERLQSAINHLEK